MLCFQGLQHQFFLRADDMLGEQADERMHEEGLAAEDSHHDEQQIETADDKRCRPYRHVLRHHIDSRYGTESEEGEYTEH